MIVTHSGTEFTSNAILSCVSENKNQGRYIAPRKPKQAGFCESFNGRMRTDISNEMPIYSAAITRKARFGAWMQLKLQVSKFSSRQ
jgi:transposase InsO family protein